MTVTPPLTFPGVYVQEVPSGVRTIVGVGTSIGMFIGASKRGPINRPRECVSYAEFRDTYGEDSTAGQLAQYVRLFFLNGGTDCWVLRIANGATNAAITLRNEANTADALILTAKDAGLDGENIRALVTYGNPQPEATFNVELYAWEMQGGRRVKTRREVWKNLSMDPASTAFAPDFLTQNSALVDAALPGALAPLIQGFSQSGRPIPHAGANTVSFQQEWAAVVGVLPTATNRFRISIDGSPFIEVDLNNPILDVMLLPVGTIQASLATEIRNRIITQFANAGIPGVNITVQFVAGPAPSPAFVGPPVPDRTTLLQIVSTTNGSIYIRPGSFNDLAVPLMLGSEQGGVEVAAHAARRPAPTGITFTASNPANWTTLAGLTQDSFTPAGRGITLDEFLPPPAVGTAPNLVRFIDPVTGNPMLETVAPNDLFYREANAASASGGNDGVREKLNLMAKRINDVATAEPLFRWIAEVAGTRLTIRPTDAVDDNFRAGFFAVNPALAFVNNVKAYTLGPGGFGIGGRQVAAVPGSDGAAPLASDYNAAYETIDKEVDLFNLMVLPPVNNAAVAVETLYGNASVFCQQRRAFLLMDPPASWSGAQDAVSKVGTLRIGVVKDYSALFYPRITVDENGLKQNIGPSGAMAGLFGRIDATRGVWKAPAGTEADLRGVVGLEEKFSDRENGILNPRAINTLRIFPSGIVSWGARTNQGDDDTPSDYKYIPVRRLALFIEESLYRGLKWVVFEPNDEPLWAQIRLNVGAFMHDLFRQGAFQGVKPKDAYFVKCDGETTTQNDRNLGIVNIWVGFAPLKPAEFVILYLQQMAGQIET